MLTADEDARAVRWPVVLREVVLAGVSGALLAAPILAAWVLIVAVADQSPPGAEMLVIGVVLAEVCAAVAASVASLPVLAVAPRGWGLPLPWPREVLVVAGASFAAALGVLGAAAECLYAFCVYRALATGGGVSRALADFGERIARAYDQLVVVAGSAAPICFGAFLLVAAFFERRGETWLACWLGSLSGLALACVLAVSRWVRSQWLKRVEGRKAPLGDQSVG